MRAEQRRSMRIKKDRFTAHHSPPPVERKDGTNRARYSTVKLSVVVNDPFGVVIVRGPLVAPTGT